jgi:hypothetical protein
MDYICPNWPFYDIGKGVKFEDGRFSTEDPGQKEIIESNDKFMVFIWPVSPPAEREEVNDQAGEGGLPAPQCDDRETTWPSEEVLEGGLQQGRETCGVLQELEELVRGSGIIGGEGGSKQPKARGKGKR